jgi:hypothetical protein
MTGENVASRDRSSAGRALAGPANGGEYRESAGEASIEVVPGEQSSSKTSLKILGHFAASQMRFAVLGLGGKPGYAGHLRRRFGTTR